MIEFLYWEGCPSHERALAQLIEQMDSVGVARDELRTTEMFTAEDAERERFVGSPTIRINGVDLVDPGDEPIDLACRVYYKRDGRPSPIPDGDDLREALERYANQIQ